MDAFFASIEQRDEPKYRHRPVIVGGCPWGRGVVATCSYEARKFGVRSAMPSRRAVELCPHAIFLPCRMDHYAAVSREIFAIFREVTDLVEPLSIDEAFLDVTHGRAAGSSATHLARTLQRRISREIGLTASTGVSYNPFLAKVASAMEKPNGLTVISPERAVAFLDALPVRKFYGIGRATAEKLEARQIFTGADLRALSLETLVELLGKNGRRYYELVRGRDPRPIVTDRPRKSLSKECTFGGDLETAAAAIAALRRLSSTVVAALRSQNLRGRTVTIRVRYANFETITRSRCFSEVSDDESSIAAAAEQLLLERTSVAVRRIRLLGVAVSGFAETPGRRRHCRGQGELPIIFENCY
jgi:DNA polymerase-4